MENCLEKDIEKPHSGINGITKEIEINSLKWPLNITTIDLSNKDIKTVDPNVIFPSNLVNLDLSHNNLTAMPTAVLKLNRLKVLNISFNSIENFDTTPNFCHTIETLNIANNKLNSPPFWIWTESPSNLIEINFSYNTNITKSLSDIHFQLLFKYKCLVKNLVMNNCCLNCKQTELLSTFPNLKTLELGSTDYFRATANNVSELPWHGFDKCCDIERLNLSNVQLYHINPNINIFKHLIEINLSQNCLNSLPSEFCSLESLEVCILSFNSLIYLPDGWDKMKNLKVLRLDCNELCMVPEKICHLPKLQVLDLYDNKLYEFPKEILNIPELDLAKNYLDEPEDEEYAIKREKCRKDNICRGDGRKEDDPVHSYSHSPSTTDDEELIAYLEKNQHQEPQNSSNNRPASSPEDWDSDEYWVPGYNHFAPAPQERHAMWFQFVKKKMEEGNFCPIDMHPTSIAEEVKYHKMCNPQLEYESDGQFDDFSDDDS